MTMDATAGRMARAPAAAGRDWDSVQFRAIFLLCLPAHLLAAAAARLSPGFWSGAAHPSLFAQAWEASGTTARIALSG